jgi:uncharacterized MAPEG superfamily protein
VNWIAGVFVLARALYSIAYITDRATMRSLLFMVAALCIVGLFVSAGMA